MREGKIGQDDFDSSTGFTVWHETVMKTAVKAPAITLTQIRDFNSQHAATGTVRFHYASMVYQIQDTFIHPRVGGERKHTWTHICNAALLNPDFNGMSKSHVHSRNELKMYCQVIADFAGERSCVLL